MTPCIRLPFLCFGEFLLIKTLHALAHSPAIARPHPAQKNCQLSEPSLIQFPVYAHRSRLTNIVQQATLQKTVWQNTLDLVEIKYHGKTN